MGVGELEGINKVRKGGRGTFFGCWWIGGTYVCVKRRR